MSQKFQVENFILLCIYVFVFVVFMYVFESVYLLVCFFSLIILKRKGLLSCILYYCESYTMIPSFYLFLFHLDTPPWTVLKIINKIGNKIWKEGSIFMTKIFSFQFSLWTNKFKYNFSRRSNTICRYFIFEIFKTAIHFHLTKMKHGFMLVFKKVWGILRLLNIELEHRTDRWYPIPEVSEVKF